MAHGNKSAVDNKVIAKRLATLGIVGNVVLSGGKLAAGIIGGSTAMISDAVHSLSDVAATAIAYLGVRVAARAADKGHPYGHERFECLASLVLSLLLALAGLGIGYAGVACIISFSQGATVGASDSPLWIALVAAVVSILVKEGMFRYTRHWARIMNSPAFLADAKHHRSDALSSIGALVGIGASMLGFPLGDPIASIVICAFVLKMAWEVAVDAVDRMVDTPVSEEHQEEIRACLAEQEGVVRVDLVLTRQFGAKVYVDAEIAVEGTLSLYEAHAIAEAAHDAVEGRFSEVKHVMVHVNPA
jgi:cation diffusion facilitator family transporter